MNRSKTTTSSQHLDNKMSTHIPQAPLPKVENMRVAIVKAMWNGHITDRLTESALKVFRQQNFPERDVVVFEVPGAVELTYAASQLLLCSVVLSRVTHLILITSVRVSHRESRCLTAIATYRLFSEC